MIGISDEQLKATARFRCRRGSGRNYDKPAAEQALERTLKFLEDHIG